MSSALAINVAPLDGSGSVFTVSLIEHAATSKIDVQQLRVDRLHKAPRVGTKDGTGFIPALFDPPVRRNANAHSMTALVSDHDKISPQTYAAICERIERSGLEAWIYETYSHGLNGLCCARVVLPFSEGLRLVGVDWRATRARGLEALGLFADSDPKCSDVCHFYYLPRHPAGEVRASKVFTGPRLDPRSFVVLAGSGPASLATIDAPRATFPPASPAVLSEARAALEAHGPAIQDQRGDPHTWRACAMMRIDFALTEGEAWPLLVEWNEDCQPPWSEIDLAAKMRGGATGSGEYGCKRSTDAVAAALGLIRSWRGDGSQQETMFVMIEAVREIVRGCGDKAKREVIEGELKSATGLGKQGLDLPKVTDSKALAARAKRERAFAAGDQGVINSQNWRSTAKLFLAHGRDAEGLAEIVRHLGSYLRAQGSHYAGITDEEIMALLYGWIDGKRDMTTGAPVKIDRATMENLSHAVKGEAGIYPATVPAWLGDSRGLPDPAGIIAFKNGLLDVASRTLLAPTRRYFGLDARSFCYDANAARPMKWLEFLFQLWGNDAEAIACLQEIFGLLMTTDTSHQKAFMLIGPKRCGKGTIFRVLKRLIGAENIAAPTLASLSNPFGLQVLINKLAALVSDVRLGRADAAAIAENILRVTGEDAVSVDRKFKDAYTAKLHVRFFINSNMLPNLLDPSGALASRFIVLKLTNTFFGREDQNLSERLYEEMPGIANWALEGLDRLRKRGHFVQPSSSAELVEELQNLGSPITQFVSERCKVAESETVACDDLYRAWCAWSQDEGRQFTSTKAIFGRDLRAAIPAIRVVQPRVNGRQVRQYAGLQLSAAQ